MSDAELQAFEPTDAAAPTTPGMRFPLRAMLLVTSGAALLAAGLGPAYRAAAPESRVDAAGLLADDCWRCCSAYLWFQWRRACAAAGDGRADSIHAAAARSAEFLFYRRSSVALATFLVSLLILLARS